MALIASSHLILILEFAILIHVGVLLLLNFIPLNFSLVFVLSLILGVGITVLFGIDAACLILPMFNHHEFISSTGCGNVVVDNPRYRRSRFENVKY